MANQKVTNIYNLLSANGLTKAKDVNEFSNWMAGSNYRQNIYGLLKQAGVEGIGSGYGEFTTLTGYGKKQPANATQKAQSIGQSVFGGTATETQQPVQTDYLARQDNYTRPGALVEQLNQRDKEAEETITKPLRETAKKVQNRQFTPQKIQYVDENNKVVDEDEVYPVIPKEIAEDELNRMAYDRLQATNKVDLEGEIAKADANATEAYRNAERKNEGLKPSIWQDALHDMADASHVGPIQTKDAYQVAVENDPEYMNRVATLNLLKEADYIQKAAEQSRKTEGKNWRENTVGWFKDAAWGMKENAKKKSTLDNGESTLATFTPLYAAAEKYDRGEQLTDSERELLRSAAIFSAYNDRFSGDISSGVKSGQVTDEAVQFMVEMGINPASGFGKALQKKLVGKGIVKLVENMAESIAKKQGRKAAMKELGKGTLARIGGDILGAAVMAGTSGLQGVAGDTLQRMQGQSQFGVDANGNIQYSGRGEDRETNPLVAAAKAFGARTIENQSEMVGAYFAPALGIGGKVLEKGLRSMKLGGVVNFIKSMGATKGAKLVDNFFEKTKWDGTIGEYAEEVVGGIENALVVGDQTLDQDPETGVFNGQQNLETFLSVALMGGFLSTFQTGVGALSYAKGKQQLNRADYLASEALGEEWSGIKQTIDHSTAENASANLSQILSDPNMSPEQKQAVREYAKRKESLRGVLYGEESRKKEKAQEKAATRPSNIDVAADGQTVVQKNQNGEVISEEKFDDEEEAKAHADILKIQRAEQDFQDDLATAIEASEQRRQAVENGTPDDFPLSEEMEARVRAMAMNQIIPEGVEEGSPEYEAFVRNMDTPGTAENDILLEMMDSFDPLEDAYESVSIDNDSDRKEIDKAIKTDPVKRTERQQKLVSEVAAHLHMFNFPKGELHPEQSFADGQTQAELDGAGTMEADPEAMRQMKQSMDDAQQALDDAVAQNTDLAAYVNETINSNEPFAPEDVISGMIGRFSDDEIATVADYINAQSKLDGYLEYTNGKMQQYVERETSKRAFKGKLNGAQQGNMVMVTDGENRYFLVNGDVQVGENGEILSAGEANGIVVVDEEGNIMPMGLDSSLRVEMGATLEEYTASLLQQQQENTTAQMGFEAPEEEETAEQPTEQPSPNPSEEGNVAEGEPSGTVAPSEEVVEAPEETEQEETVSDEKISEIDAALAKIPTRKSEKDGEPDYIWEDAPAEDTIDALAAINDGNMDAVSETATMMRKEAESELKKAEKLKTSGKNPIEMAKSRAENRQKAEEAQKRLDYWKAVEEQVKGLIKQAEEAPLRQAEEEDASTRAAIIEEKSDNDAKWKALHQLYDGTIADDGEILDESRPMDINELVAMNMPRNIAWESYTVDGTHVKRGLQDELGSHHTRGIGKNVGTNAFNTFLAKKGTGISIDEAIHQIWESGENELANGEKRFSDQEIRNAVIDMFLSAEKPSDITNYVVNNRSRLANEKMRQEEEYMREQEANAYADAEAQTRGFADADEESDYNEFIAEEIKLQAEYEQRTEEGTAEQMPPVAESAEGGEQSEGGTAESAGTEREVPLSEPGETETEGDTESGTGDNAADGGVHLEGGEYKAGLQFRTREGGRAEIGDIIDNGGQPVYRIYYYAENGAVGGDAPMTADELRAEIENGALTPVSEEDAATQTQPTVETPSGEPESTVAEEPKKEEKNPSGNKLVTDERYEELKKRMRDKLLGQMNIGVDPEILALGVEMAVYHIEKGARKFAEYAKAMIEDMGDVIRPYLKAFYNGARDLPEMEELSKEMDDYGTVQSFDVANFDKQTADPMAQAQQIRDEKKVEKDAETAKESLNYDKQDTDTVNVNKKENKKKKKSVSLQEIDLFNQNTENNEQEIRRNNGLQAEPVSSSEGEGQESGEPERVREGGSPEQDRSEQSGLSDTVEETEAEPQPVPQEKKNQRNNRNERGRDYAPTSATARVNANIAAIELLKRLEEENRDATPEEMAVLKQYSGWGGLGGAFNENSPLYNKVREVLDDAEYDSAAMSINSAYFTPASVIDRLWDVAAKLGFKGGNILESSAGIGNIIASIPESMNERSDIEMVEIDSISGRILAKLYPDAKVNIKGFEDTKIENGSIDLAITNVPFVTGLKVRDEVDTDLSRQFGNIHDFVIAKNIRKLKEGGIGIFITTSNTLDKSDALREWIDNKGDADVMGVFRLNNATFEGTTVTSDIIVVRKRVNGERHPDAIDVKRATVVREGEYEDRNGKYDWKAGRYETKRTSMKMNAYLSEHPENMGGEMAFAYEKGDTFRPGSYGLYPSADKSQAKMLDAWVSKMKNVFAAAKQQPTVKTEDTEVREGRMFVKDGKIYVSQKGKAVPYSTKKSKVKGKSVEECAKDYVAIRESLGDVLKYQLENEGDEGLKPLLDKLNKAYDNFVKKYGYLHKNVAISFLRDDIEFPDVAALENYSESKDMEGNKIVKTSKSKVFEGRVLRFKTEPKPQSVKDGVLASVQQFGKIDIPWIAATLPTQRTEQDVKAEILREGYGFEDPITRKVEVRYEYLSGNVREKLRQARENNEDGRYDKNIEELEKVVPMDIPAHLIDFQLGSSWVDPKLYEDYVWDKYGCRVKFVNAGGAWSMEVLSGEFDEKNRAGGVFSRLFNITIPASKLVEAAINNRTVKVQRTEKNWDGTKETITDKEASQSCQNRIGEIKDEFTDWAKARMQEDVDMAEKMMRVYNDKFNAMVPKEVDDTFIPEQFEGAASYIHLYPHQSKAVMRAITEPVMLAHQVGAGKTFTLITTAMEMRRLGTAKKPMIVVQNATVGQFVAAAKTLYPNAKILSLTEKDRDAEGRRAFYGKIKYNDWDMIVIPQSTFERIPDSPERQLEFIQEKIDDKMHALDVARQANADFRLLNQMEKDLEDLENEYSDVALGKEPTKKKGKKKDEEKTKQNVAARAKEQLDRHADDVMYFDEMGIDALLIDEAHEYKRLGFSTTMTRGVKGIDPAGSKKSAGVYLKTRGILKNNGWKNVVFATGTPISNTAAEIWTFMRYLMPREVMEANEIWYFDDFVHNFGKVSQSLEFATNGKFKENTRFAAYINKPELIRIWSTVADTVLAKDMPEVDAKLPSRENGKDQDVFLPQTQSLIGIMKAVRKRLEEFEKMSGAEKRENSSIPLVMYGLAKRAAIDPRLVDEGAVDEPNSKTNKAVGEVVKDLKDTERYNGTVAIFCDMQNGPGGFNIFQEMKRKLMEQGIPENQIAIITSGMTINAKEKIFEQVNSGEIRVIMGSTQTLGTGVNIQERLHLLIHMDAPDRPMDYTQRNGRILRQGNLHKDWDLPVRILRFGVEDSLDVTSYQRLKTKSGFIDSIMDGKAALQNNQVDRTLEEEEEGLFDNPVAVLSGSQYALKKTQAERELRKWQSKKQQWESDQIYIENTLRRNNGQNRKDEENIKEYDRQIELAKQHFPEGKATTITIKGVETKTQEELDKAITEQVNKPIRERVEAARKDVRFERAIVKIPVKFDDLTITVEAKITRETEYVQGKGVKTTMHTVYAYKIPELGFDEYSPTRGYMKDVIDDIKSDVAAESVTDWKEAARKAIAKRTKDNEMLEARRSPSFKDEDKLEAAREKVAEYTEKMKEEMAEKEAKYAAMDAEEVDIEAIEDNAEEEDDDSGTRLRESFVNNLDENDIEDENDVSLQETPLVYLDEHIQELEKEIQEARQEGRANQENEGLPSSSDKERSARITELQNTLNEYKEERVRREEKMDAFRKKYGIKKGEDVDLETVVRIFLDLNPSENLIRIFKGVALKASALKVRFEIKEDGSVRGVKGMTSTESAHIQYNLDALAREGSSEDKASTIVHEMVHQATQYILIAYLKDPSSLSEKDRTAAKSIIDIFEIIKKDRPELYGAKSELETIAEIGKPKFREALEKIPYGSKNLWERFKDIVRKWFGFSPKNNALKGLEKALDSILDNYDYYNYYRTQAYAKDYRDKARKRGERVEDLYEDELSDSDVRFRLLEVGSVFFSNAERAVEGIKQEKATPEQWLKMIEKNGGLKAGEDKWMGLSEWLKGQDKKSLTKQEVLDFIRENQIQVEEVNYADQTLGRYDEHWDYLRTWLEENTDNPDAWYNTITENYGYRDGEGFYLNQGTRMPKQVTDMVDRINKSIDKSNPINSTRLSYTTRGLENKREIALVVPTVESWNESDEIHFGDAGNGRVVAWVRFGETTTNQDGVQASRNIMDELEQKYGSTDALDQMSDEDVARREFANYLGRDSHGDVETSKMFISSDVGEERAKKVIPIFEKLVKDNAKGERVLVIDEIQSKRHQQGREKGYITKEYQQELERLTKAYRKTQRELDDFEKHMIDKYNVFEEIKTLTVEETERRLRNMMNEAELEEYDNLLQENEQASMEKSKFVLANGDLSRKVPEAPFDKNWHELAMKRILRYAAENGYDKVAWTKGAQQAERYDIGGTIDSIYNAGENTKGLTDIDINLNSRYRGIIHLQVDKDGNVKNVYNDSGNVSDSPYIGKNLSEIIGKGLAEKVMELEEGKEISGEGLRIGGEGMKGFYDQMLPRFMDKYGKKWGVKTGEVELPNVEESGRKMWAVDVTPEMKESVMQGQPLFREGSAATQSQPAEKMKEHLTKLSKKIGTKVVFHDDASTITNTKVKEALQKGKKVAGWYDPKDNSVHFYMPNIKDRYEAEKTIWHEVVGHKGMRALLGEEGYRTFMRRLWMDKSEDFEEMHQWVVENYMRYGGNLYETIDEWFAYNVVEPSVPKTMWDKVMQVLSDVLRKLGFMTTPNMKDMKYMLWLSRNAIREGDAWTELQRNATLAKLDLESRRRAASYSNDGTRARDGFANTPTGDTEREMYRSGLMRKMFAWTEAHQDYMASAKLLMDAILKGRKVLDRFNFYMKENHADSKIKIMEDLYVRDYCKPMEEAINRCIAAIGGKLSEAYEVLEDYMAMKHGLERNREFFVRDWMEEKRKKTPTIDDLDEEAKSEYESAVRGIEQGFEDGQIETEEERDTELRKALEDSYSAMLDRIEEGWAAAKSQPTDNLAEWLKGLDDYIRQHIDNEYEAGKHDYSGLTALQPTPAPPEGMGSKYDYDDDAVVGYVMDMESKIGKENVDELWNQKARMTQFALDIEHEAGLITDKNYEKVSQMFHWYMPLRKWDEDMAEDIWSYMNSKKNTYVGRTLMKAGGRKSRAAMPIGTMFAMGGNAISRAARNEVKKAFAGFVRMYERPAANNDNDNDPLVTELEAWVENLGTEENPDWVYSFPDIPENATANEVREAKNAWAQHMLELMQEGRAMRVRQGDTIPYRFESKKRSRPEHIVEVYEEGQPHFFIVNDNPRAAQAINGQLKPETKHKITAQINRFMSSVFTSYSPTFMARNAFRDAEFASSMLSVKEGWDYCQKFMKNYMKVTNFAGKRPLMFTLFRKFRDGTLDVSDKMERYFKEFAENGGITGYVMENNAERWEKEILAGVKEIGENQVVGITKNIIKRFMEGVEHAGEAIENAARFATYVTSRESGRTVTKSVNDAKEVSVNFNRKGAGYKTESLLNEKGEKTANNVWAAKTAQYMRANTLFYNASLQGIMNTVGNAARKPWWFAAKFAIPPMVLGALVPVFNAWVHAMLDDDDDKVSDDPYADLPEYTRRMNMCLYIGHGKFLMIPLSIEHRAFFGLGDIMAGQTYDEKLKNVNKPLAVDAVSQLTAFSPVDYNSREMGIEGVTGWGVGIIVPAYISPLVNAYFNKSWTGSQIQKENAFGGSNLPEYQKAKDYTNKTLVGASRMWHELWGGNDAIRAGREQDSKVMEWIGEVSPAKMEYVVEQYFGEPGKLGTGVSDMFSMMFGNKEADLRKIPVVKAFATLPNENTQFRRANTKYWKYRDEFKKVEQDDRQYRSRIDDDPVLKLEYENKFKKSKRYKQWRIYHPGKGGEGFKYKKNIEDLQKRINAEDDPVQKRGMQHERNILVQQLVDTLDNIE